MFGLTTLLVYTLLGGLHKGTELTNIIGFVSPLLAFVVVACLLGPGSCCPGSSSTVLVVVDEAGIEAACLVAWPQVESVFS